MQKYQFSTNVLVQFCICKFMKNVSATLCFFSTTTEFSRTVVFFKLTARIRFVLILLLYLLNHWERDVTVYLLHLVWIKLPLF